MALIKKRLQEVVQAIQPNIHWLNKYIKQVPVFIEEAAKELDWHDVNEQLMRDYLFLNKGHCAGSIGQGSFTKKDQNRLPEYWPELAKAMAKLARHQHEPDFKTYDVMDELIRAHTGKNLKLVRRRAVATLQPFLLSTLYNTEDLKSLHVYINKNIKNGETLIYENNWYKDSHALLTFFAAELDVSRLNYDGLTPNTLDAASLNKMKLMTLPWQLHAYLLPNLKQQLVVTDHQDPFMINEIATILLNHKPQVILQGPPGTGKTYTAFDVAEQLICGAVSADKIKQQQALEQSGQFEVIQFHPAYGYEDFIQGIAVSVDEHNNQVKYEVESRILMTFADKALKNHQNHFKNIQELEQEQGFEQDFEAFVLALQNRLDAEASSIPLSQSTCCITAIDEAKRIIYVEGEAKRFTSRVKFDDLKQCYLAGNQTRKEIKDNPSISPTARQHATYVERILTMFRERQGDKHHNPLLAPPVLNKYVLIIDEINRANLMAVLGELIYALEYRGKSVKTLYGRNDSAAQHMSLPPNLYIIGTMNTADRSVDSMDYAIRRRFAFVKVLPQLLPIDALDKALFQQVSKLFVANAEAVWADPRQALHRSEHLSEEFNPEDVWMGHSYFIAENPQQMRYRMQYEILPLLEEYLRDSVLKKSALEIVERLKYNDHA